MCPGIQWPRRCPQVFLTYKHYFLPQTLHISKSIFKLQTDFLEVWSSLLHTALEKQTANPPETAHRFINPYVDTFLTEVEKQVLAHWTKDENSSWKKPRFTFSLEIFTHHYKNYSLKWRYSSFLLQKDTPGRVTAIQIMLHGVRWGITKKGGLFVSSHCTMKPSVCCWPRRKTLGFLLRRDLTENIPYMKQTTESKSWKQNWCSGVQ